MPWSYSPTRQISIFLARELSRHHRVGELPLHRCSSSSVRSQVREVAAPVHRGPRVLTVRTLSQVAPRRATANHTKLSALCTVPGQRSGPMLHASGPIGSGGLVPRWGHVAFTPHTLPMLTCCALLHTCVLHTCTPSAASS
jgi:hypothetical protein